MAGIIRAAVDKVKELADRFAKWAAKNPEGAIIAVSATVAGTKFLIREIGKERRASLKAKEEYMRKSRIWDPSERHYWNLRRPLSNREWEKVYERHDRGESLYMTLWRMGVLAP